jgi:hypothetical protein
MRATTAPAAKNPTQSDEDSDGIAMSVSNRSSPTDIVRKSNNTNVKHCRNEFLPRALQRSTPKRRELILSHHAILLSQTLSLTRLLRKQHK